MVVIGDIGMLENGLAGLNSDHHYFSLITNSIFKKNPLQRKMIQSFLSKQDEIFFQRAEQFSEKIFLFLATQELGHEVVANAYLKMCRDMLIEQIKFKKTGKYSCSNMSEAHKNVYTSEQEMSSYMLGLALSLFLWPNHYRIFDYFISEISKMSKIANYLEIGPGHGLFLMESLKQFPTIDFLAVDISPISLQLCQSLVSHFLPQSKCAFLLKDINEFNESRNKYDFIVMCEVLEHLDCPLNILKKTHSLLHDEGRLFITTCANCPAIDHVYLYENLGHIRREIHAAGFSIESDLPLPVGDCPKDNWTDAKIELNYAAMLRKG